MTTKALLAKILGISMFGYLVGIALEEKRLFMKKTLLLSLFLFSLLFSVSLSAHTLTVNISNIQNHNGVVRIGLYTKAENFTIVDKVYRKGVISNFQEENISYSFDNIPSGVYAFSIFHDENSNGQVDKNFLGIPKEGYGFSNNLRFMLRSATFEESQFKLVEDINIAIEMGY